MDYNGVIHPDNHFPSLKGTPVSEVIQSQIQEWRRKAREGTLTPEELRAAINAIRKERVEASDRSSTSRARTAAAKEKAKPIDSEALLNGFF